MSRTRPLILLKLLLTAFLWGGTWIAGRSAVVAHRIGPNERWFCDTDAAMTGVTVEDRE